jgi:GNAT superfamily N-acetyltransferase
VTLVPEGTVGATAVVVTDLEMLDIRDLRPAAQPALLPGPPAVLRHVEPPDAALSARCYERVGGQWTWVDRLAWTTQMWQGWVDAAGHEQWVVQVGDELAGYFELAPDLAGSVEVAYFGLTAGFVGRGLGGWLLTQALRRAWQLPSVRRVWLHTCELDSPAALPNYLARGMRICGSSVEHRMVTANRSATRPPDSHG